MNLFGRKSKIQPIPVKLNCCPLCGVEIIELCDHCDKLQANPKHVQFMVYYSPAGKTDISMCDQCFVKVTEEQVCAIFEGIKQHWFDTGFKDPMNNRAKIIRIDKKDFL
jgi:hypothetical protein